MSVKAGIDSIQLQIGVSQNSGYLFGDPYNRDHSTLGSILGSTYVGKLANGSYMG